MKHVESLTGCRVCVSRIHQSLCSNNKGRVSKVPLLRVLAVERCCLLCDLGFGMKVLRCDGGGELGGSVLWRRKLWTINVMEVILKEEEGEEVRIGEGCSGEGGEGGGGEHVDIHVRE